MKSGYKKDDKKIVLTYGEQIFNWIEDGRAESGNWSLSGENQIIMDNITYTMARVGERDLVLERDVDGWQQQYLFAPENCPCWRD